MWCGVQFAVVDVECSETIMKLQARDQRIAELNKQILKLKEDMREQTEWSTLQMEQLRMAQMQEKERSSRKKDKEKKAADLEDKSKHNRVVKTIARKEKEKDRSEKKIVAAAVEEKSEWDEV